MLSSKEPVAVRSNVHQTSHSNMADGNVSTVSTETTSDMHTSEKRTSKSHVSIRRSSIYPGLGSGFSSSMASMRIRRQSTRSSIPRAGYDFRNIRYENTYRMEPAPDHKADMDQLHRLTTDILDSAMHRYRYDPNRVRKFVANLAERIRNEIKSLPFKRYKTIVQVVIGQKRSQGLLIASRCLWDVELDRHLTITKQTANAFVTAAVFLVYNE